MFRASGKGVASVCVTAYTVVHSPVCSSVASSSASKLSESTAARVHLTSVLPGRAPVAGEDSYTRSVGPGSVKYQRDERISTPSSRPPDASYSKRTHAPSST